MISSDDWKWLLGLIVAQILSGATFINLSLNDKLKHPLRVAFPSVILIGAVETFIAYKVTSNYFAEVLVILATLFVLGIIAFSLKERDVKGIYLGEDFIEFERAVDLQISFILDLIARKNFLHIDNAIQLALKYILDVLSDFLVRNGDKKNVISTSLTILLAKSNGKFQVLAHNGITVSQIEYIEKNFRYKPRVVSLAGYAVRENKTCCIPDLSLSSTVNELISYWVKTDAHEKREGFLLCYPIDQGINVKQAKPLAVICVSSHENNAYDQEIVLQILIRVVPKIENLLILYRSFQGEAD